MPGVSRKSLTIRAFRIENQSLTEPHSGIIGLLQCALTPQSTAAQRRMPLNAEDPDRDLLANYTFAPNGAFMFGMMLRIIPAESGGVIDEDLFGQPTITMSQINAGNHGQSQYKGHFYFALNNEYLVTNLSGNIGIERLQTYLNWLLEEARGSRLFQFTELTKVPDGVRLSQIKDIQFVGGGNVVSATPNDSRTISQSLWGLTYELLTKLINDTSNLPAIRASQLVEAKLLIKLKSKPKEMAMEEFQRAMGAIATNVTNDNGIVIRTKDGSRFTGDAVKVRKTVSIECSDANRIVEEQLRQEMELFLSEIMAQQSV